MSLNSYTLPELKQLARDNKIPLAGATRKQDIVDILSKSLPPLAPLAPLAPLTPLTPRAPLSPIGQTEPSAAFNIRGYPTYEREKEPLTKISRGEAFWYIPKECSKRFGENQIDKVLGIGNWGSVYNYCETGERGPCKRVVKIVPIFPIKSREAGVFEEDYRDGTMPAKQYEETVNMEDVMNEYNRRRAAGLPKNEQDFELEESGDLGDVEQYLPVSLQTRIEDFEREERLSKIGSNLGISPHVYDSFICDNVLREPEGGHLITVGFIIMDRWDTSVGRWHQDHPDAKIPHQLVQKLQHQIEIMHDNGIIHGDLHLENIMLRLGPDGVTPVDIAIIDFGSAAGFAKNLTSEQLEQAKQHDLNIAGELLYQGLTNIHFDESIDY